MPVSAGRSACAFCAAARHRDVREIGRSGRARHLQRSGLQSAALDVATEATRERTSDKWRNAARWTGEHNEMWRRGIITVIAAGLLSACGEEKGIPRRTRVGSGDCVTFEEGPPDTRHFPYRHAFDDRGDPPRLSMCRH
jgi:hypothetical protein